MQASQALFEAAAATLLDPCGCPHPDALALLQLLDCPLPAVPGAAERHRALLFCAAAGFIRVFQLDAEDAPGLAVFGGEVEPDRVAAEPGLPVASVSGAGPTRLRAFEACVGEGVEYLSQVETAADRAARLCGPDSVPPRWRERYDAAASGAASEWVRLRRVADGQDAWLPADACLRRPATRRVLDPPWPLSIGCAAGVSTEAAALHGLLELIERDAAAIWWRGGRRGRSIALEDAASEAASSLVARLRRGRSGRRSWLLDITTDLGVPVVAAVSFAPDGRGFCCGTAARTTLQAAACAAVLEMCQMELAHAVALAKRRERGEAALNARDRDHLRRFADLDAGRCALVHPAGPGQPSAALPADPGPALDTLVGRLAARGLDALMLDLTRPGLGIPVVRMVCLGLEVEPSETAGPRLLATVAEAGGGGCQTGGIRLM